MEWDRKVVTSQAHDLFEKGELTFLSRKELITSAANILALVYLEHLEHWRATAKNFSRERDYWNEIIANTTIRYRDALHKNIEEEAQRKFLGIEKRKIYISHEHRKLIDLSLSMIGKRSGSTCGISWNEMYVIDLRKNKLHKVIR